MRSARAADHWRTVKKRVYQTWISSLDMQGLLGFNGIQFSGGVFAICGLNGAGKSTVISSLKDALGIQLTIQDDKRLGSQRVNAIINSTNGEIACSNEDGSRAFDKGLNVESAEFFDYSKSTQALEYFLSQKNLDEFIEQNEESDFSQEDVKELSYIVGKQYRECSFVEINDVFIGEMEIGTIPFFKVQCDGDEYDSTTMGIGEHFIFYIYWALTVLAKNTMLIIEEPETFISIASQERLMNYIASIVAEKGVSVIISTHSPFILDNVPIDNICILNRVAGISDVVKPNKAISTFSLLGSRLRKDGVIFVEDLAAKLFLSVILEDKAPDLLRAYSIESVGGDGEISRRLAFPALQEKDYCFIGVYDGDVIAKINEQKSNYNWPYLFLPISSPEEEIRNILSDHEYIKVFCERVGIDLSLVVSSLTKFAGEDGHDWFLDICKETSLDPKQVVRTFYRIWLQSNESQIEAFIESLYSVMIST